MKTFDYTITDEIGIHARPAGMLVTQAKKYNSEISILSKGRTADCKKLISILMLAVKKGDSVTLNILGEDEEVAENEMKAFFTENL